MRMVEASALLSILAVSILGCGSVSTQLTGYGEQLKLKPKRPCAVHVFYSQVGIPPHAPVAILQYDGNAGLMSAGAEATTDAFREEACDIGADGVIVHEGDYRMFGSGTHATATAFVWVRPQPLPRPPPEVVTVPAPAACEPACRDGFACVRGQCVSACNPACASSEQCTTVGTSARCVTGSDAGSPLPLSH